MMNWTQYEPLALKIGQFFLAFSFLERNMRFKAHWILGAEKMTYEQAASKVQKMSFSKVLTVLEDSLPNNVENEILAIQHKRNLFAHGRFGIINNPSKRIAILNHNDVETTCYLSLLELDNLIDQTIKLSNKLDKQ